MPSSNSEFIARWPAKLRPPRTSRVTPGVSSTNAVKSRPLTGKSEIKRLSIVVLISLRLFSSRGGLSVTVIVSLPPATVNRSVSVNCAPTVRSIGSPGGSRSRDDQQLIHTVLLEERQSGTGRDHQSSWKQQTKYRGSGHSLERPQLPRPRHQTPSLQANLGPLIGIGRATRFRATSRPTEPHLA